MFRPSLTKWDRGNTALENMLLLAQAIHSLLLNSSTDTYRARALNAHVAAWELSIAAKQARRGERRPGAVRSIVEELEVLIADDPVLDNWTKKLTRRMLGDLDTKKQQFPLGKLVASSDIIKQMIADQYWSSLLKGLRQAVRLNTPSSEVYQLASALCSECEIYGISRRYLFHITTRFFFDGDEPSRIISPDQIVDYLSLLDRPLVEWSVLFRGSAKFSDYLSEAKAFGIIVTDAEPYVPLQRGKLWKVLAADRTRQRWVEVHGIQARDSFGARRTGEGILRAFASVVQFVQHRGYMSWSRVAWVCNKADGSVSFTREYPSAMRCSLDPRDDEDGMGLQSKAQLASSMFVEGRLLNRDAVALQRAIESHHNALSTRVPESQLLALWSAIEGVLPTPEGEMASVSHFARCILPCVTLSYVKRRFKAISRAMQSYGSAGCHFVIDACSAGQSWEQKLFAILICEELNLYRSELMRQLENDPYLRFQCARFTDAFSSGKSTAAALHRHRRNVEWQIQRIYAVRNQVVHAASTIPYISTLVENLHTYFDLLINSIIDLVDMTQPRDGRLGSLVALIQAMEQEYLGRLTSSKAQVTGVTAEQLILPAGTIRYAWKL